MDLSNTTFSELFVAQQKLLESRSKDVSLDGKTLTVADVVAISRGLLTVNVASEACKAIGESSCILKERLEQGEVIYGVNTGFGGSADQRIGATNCLQQRLFTLLMVGITSTESLIHAGAEFAATCMPEAWVRASMVVRLNSLAAGASGVRTQITERLCQMLNCDIVPVVPLRGSISASGDLIPLSYIGAVLQGKKYASAFVGPRLPRGLRRPMRADVALAQAKLPPLDVHAKEGLAIVNGTAVSAGVAALAAHECMNLAALSQVLTAMSVEALCGTDESFDPFIAQMRLHPGQIDSAQNIFHFLEGSSLVNSGQHFEKGALRQDRYSIRTASQWIGPVLEDFQLAYVQISTELNSVTDNPLVDRLSRRIIHGGNFQAKAITVAVEKLRAGLQSLGRMIFSQCTELINPNTNRGLPPNLVADDPATSFLFKGTDIMTAALTSELGFLANPVGSHVQTAEMGNQGINSLALISARYTVKAVETFSQLVAAHIIALCQAIDLRARDHFSWKAENKPDASSLLGCAAKAMYLFVRTELKIPFVTEALVSGDGDFVSEGVSPSLGLYNTMVYEAIRSGRLNSIVLECIEGVQEKLESRKHKSRL